MPNKRIKKKKQSNEIEKQQQFFKKIFENTKEEDILHVNKEGVVQIDFSNPKHVDTYKRWIED